ncbi:MAG TPA: GDP-mannose 4,6-dehydratase [Caulobacteraceae bacterium]|jgi:GDPmannose 4,6-dehydratase
MRAFITGITGQDGSYLAELLIAKGYEVHGLIRRVSQPNTSNLAAVLGQITLHTGDMTDGLSLARILDKVRPDEIYNLAGMSQVRDSYDHPEVTLDVNAGGLLRILETCRTLRLEPRVYQACSSEMFGRVRETPQTETTAFYPRSPYGASKVAAFELARVWREAYGARVSCGILFNHESPRRGPAFLSRKVCQAVAEIAAGRRDKLILGNLAAKRDWGYAPEYVEWIWRILQHETADDFVIATGETHSVEEFVAAAFAHVGIADWRAHVDYDEDLTRPAEVDLLCGDAAKSRRVLGFEPRVKFAELVAIMVDAEMAKLAPPRAVHSDARRVLESFPDAKLITVKEDCEIGGHFHTRKDEIFILSEGEGRIAFAADSVGAPMVIGRIYRVRAGTPHWFLLKAGSILVGLNTRAYDPADDHPALAHAAAA